MILRLLQLCSPSLPIGAYSYSEGIETLCNRQIITDAPTLRNWLEQELGHGSIRVEAAIMARIHQGHSPTYWNNWLSASRETAELRASSWQMGTSLAKLLMDIEPAFSPGFREILDHSYPQGVCNLAIAFGIAAKTWQIELDTAVAAYLYNWASNLVSAGLKLIPLGQTAGQQLIYDLQPQITQTSQVVLNLADRDLTSWNLGLAIASMHHAYQYSRLFRS